MVAVIAFSPSTREMVVMSKEWEPVVSPGVALKDLFAARPSVSKPIQMRKKDPGGKWHYRDATPEEIEDYLSSEAW